MEPGTPQARSNHGSTTPPRAYAAAAAPNAAMARTACRRPENDAVKEFQCPAGAATLAAGGARRQWS